MDFWGAPVQGNRWAIGLGLWLLGASCALAIGTNNPADIPTTASIATLRGISAAAAVQIANIKVQSYYGVVGDTCSIDYSWNSSDTRTDDGGGIINPTGNSGNGRWDLVLAPGAFPQSCQWGVKVDSAITSAAIGTDNTTQMQNMLNWAYNYSSNHVVLGGKKGYCIGTTESLIPNEGEVVEGAGQQQYTGLNPGNSCVYFYSTSVNANPAFYLQTPYPGHGLTPFESPKFYNLGIYTNVDDQNTAPTGCIQLNSNSGGFTNDNTSQQPVAHPVFQNISCIMGYGESNEIGIYCGKCIDGRANNIDCQFGTTCVVWDGSDDMEIGGSCRLSETYSYMVKFLQEGGSAQFGNNDRINGCQLLDFAAKSQAVDAFIFSSAISADFQNLFIEGAAPAGGSLAAQFDIDGGVNVRIENNYISGGPVGGPTVPWIEFSACPFNFTGINNAVAGQVGFPTWPSNFGCTYWYNAAPLARQFVHYGNTQYGDTGWPFNSVSIYPVLGSAVNALYTPSTPGLSYAGLGVTEIPYNNEFVLGPTGSSNFLLFQNSYPGSNPLKGTFNVQIYAYQSNASSGQITCQMTDGGLTVGSSIAQAITGAPKSYTLSFSQATSTSGGVECWNSGTAGTSNQGVRLGQIMITN